MEHRQDITISEEQLERLRRAPRDPSVWKELEIHLPDSVQVVVNGRKVIVVRSRSRRSREKLANAS